MKHSTKRGLPALLLCAAAASVSTQSTAEDIDIFTGASGGLGADPKILIILDNTSNWSRASQQWPGLTVAGQGTWSAASTAVTTTGTFTTGQLVVGCTVAGTGIPGNATVASISSPTSFTLSSATTGAGSSSQLTFTCPGVVQGQSETRAVNTLLGGIGSNVNLGLMEYVTGGTATETGGFIRHAVVPMTDANKTTLSTQLTTIFNDINSPDEKRNANTEYGNLMYDAYNYFTGGNSVSPAAVLASKADSNGYTTNYTRFRSPLSDDNACGRNFLIFIGNPNTNGPAADTADNGTALTNLGGSVSPQIQVPEFTSSVQTTATNIGFSSQCYSSAASCTSTAPTTDFAAQCAAGAGYENCSCSNSLTTTSLDACLSGTQRFSVLGNTNTGGSTTTTTTTATVTNPTTGTTGCYATSAAATAAADHGGLSLPPGTTTTSGSTTTTTTNSNDSYTVSASPSTTATQNCAPTNSNPVLGSNQITTDTALSASCYGGISTGNPKWNASTDYGGMTCPATSTTTSGDNTTTITYSCAYAGVMSADATGCSGVDKHVSVTQTVTGSPSTVTANPNYKFDVTQTYTQQSAATTTTGATTTQTLLGNTSLCYADCSTGEFSGTCSGYNGGCTCAAPTTSAGQCSSGARYMVTGNVTGTVVTPTGNFITASTAANADEWARFMHQPRACDTSVSADCTGQIKQSITTDAIDVFNKRQSAKETELSWSMASAGGGKYFAATSEAAIVAALKKILAEIQSVNSTFASASLPVNATNRTQNANQVFIGMFRPDPDANPRWMGNLKQYQIGKIAGDLDLVDLNGKAATNALTGFIDNCAVAFWTTNSVWPTNSTNYWANVVINPDPASNCDPTTMATLGGATYSDLPDGPTVEKGAVAEILRKGNDPGVSPTWTTTNRNVLTLSGSSITGFTAATSGLSANLAAFTSGVDVANDTGLYNASTNPYQTRPSIHGDVVHSRPLPVNFGAAGVTVYYGVNDGTLRAVDAANGKERWAFVAPEHYSKLQRLMDNTPGVNYNIPATPVPPFTSKSYFFDGSIGVYQSATGANPPVYIYPTQRRGGRMVYGLDVTIPTNNPTLLWRHGCDDVGTCDTGFSQMGQTWSTPNVAFINGYSPDKTTTPVVVIGGGYDACEDGNTISPGCGSTTGNVIYFVDATTGALITSFATERAVAADVNLIDLNNDGLVDYAYAADTGGNIYRVDFVSSPTTVTPLEPTSAPDNTGTGNWHMHKVAYTSGGYRKFLFGPGLFPTGTSTYLAIVSGDREHPVITDYPYTTPVVNKAYIYKDDLTTTPSDPAVNLDGSDMLDQTSLSDATCTSRNLLTSTDKKGWFMNLTENGVGEQGVTAAVIVGGMVTFSTNRPFSTGLSCGTRLGEARGYFVNLFNGSGTIGTTNNAACGGSRSSVFAGGGLPPSPVIGIVPIDGVPTAVLIGAPPREPGPVSPIKPSKIVPPINQTRTRTYKYLKGD